MVEKSNSENGFSLVEVLVALSVSSLILIALSGIIQNGLEVNARTKKQAEASSLAFKKVQDYINLDFDNVPIGDVDSGYEIEDFSDEAEALNLVNASAKIYSKPESVVNAASSTVTTNFAQTIAADSAFVSGSEISSVRVHDALGIYWNRNRISDDSFSNYTYNAYSAGPDNKPLPSIDLGSSQLVDSVRIEWWTCDYGASNFRIEAKNSSPTNNSGWTTIVSGLSNNTIPCSSSESASQDVDVSSNTTPYRYWRMFVVDGTHQYWNVVSEFEAFSAGSPGDIVEQHGADASSNPGSLYFSDSDLEMSEDGVRGHQSVGILFDDFDAIQGADITNAYIEFTADEANSDDVTLEVIGVDVDNAPSWSGSFAVDNAVDGDSSDGLVGTTARTSWAPASWAVDQADINTRVDVTSIISEIVSRPGWEANNSLAVAVQYTSGSGKRVAKRNPAPRLVVEWSQSTTIEGGDYIDSDGDGDADNPTLLRVTAIIEYDVFQQRRRVEYQALIREFGIAN